MKIRNIFTTLTMSIVIMLPSATAFVPVTHADPPILPGGGGNHDCDDEYAAWINATGVVIAARAAMASAIANERQTHLEAEALYRAYVAVKLIPSAGSPTNSPIYSPYADKTAWETALNAAHAAWSAAAAAHAAAIKAMFRSMDDLRNATYALSAAWASLLSCLNS